MRRDWTLNQGLAAQYAAQAGLDPDIAAAAGETGWNVLKALRDAVSERDARRCTTLAKNTLKSLEKVDFTQHQKLDEDQGIMLAIDPKRT